MGNKEKGGSSMAKDPVCNMDVDENKEVDPGNRTVV